MRKGVALMTPSASASCSPRKTSWGAQSRIFFVLSVTGVMAILALFSRLIASTSETPVEFQSLYASHGERDGISIVEDGRVLQEEEDVGEPRINYGTQLLLFMCNPSLVEDGNDASRVDTARLTLALSRILGLGQTDPDNIEVTMKTGPSDPDDLAYMCETDGMLQWHAMIDFDADDSAVSGMTPAVMAAQANDYITYSSSEFRALLSASINDEYASSSETVDLSAEDIVVRNVGWIVTFPSEISVLEAETTGSSDDAMIGVAAYVDLWDLWMWLVMGLLLGCCIGPICLCLCRKRDDKNAITRDCRGNNQISEEIRGPKWSTKEPDIEKDCLHDEEMAIDHDGAGRGIGFKSYSLPNQVGHRDIVDREYVQKNGKRPGQPSSSLPRPDGHYVHRMGLNHEDVTMTRSRGNQPKNRSDTCGRSRRYGFGDDD